MIRRTVATLAVAVAAAAAVPTAASANPYPNGKAHRIYRAAFIECRYTADAGWSLARSERAIRSERTRSALSIALQGCQDGWRFHHR
jgi:hypothetical protein